MTHSHFADDQLVEMCLTGSPSRFRSSSIWASARHAQARRDRHRLAARRGDRRGGARRRRRGVSRRTPGQAAGAHPPAHRAGRASRPRPRVSGRPGARGHRCVRSGGPASRWIAAAAVAGLVVGLVAGRIGQRPSALSAATADARPATPFDAAFRANVSASDEEFLGQIELAIAAVAASAQRSTT